MRKNSSILLLAVLALTVFIQAQQNSSDPELETLLVQGNVHLIAGAGGNVLVQTGAQGTLVVDTGSSQMSDKVLAAIHKLSAKPIQYIVNTSFDLDHTGGNDALKKSGVTYTGANVSFDIKDAASGAAIYAHDNVMQRLSAPSGKISIAPPAAWPTSTFVSGRKQLSFNNEAVEIIHQPHAHTDGDSIVFFRRSDVIAAGDTFLMTTYPVIDVDHGGSIQGELEAMNNIIDIAVPQHQEEGGTYIVPGHGRICDRFEVVEYRDAVAIIRDRVQDAIKKGMTLQQIKASPVSKDFDFRYGGPGGEAREQFLTAIYRGLTSK